MFGFDTFSQSPYSYSPISWIVKSLYAVQGVVDIGEFIPSIAVATYPLSLTNMVNTFVTWNVSADYAGVNNNLVLTNYAGVNRGVIVGRINRTSTLITPPSGVTTFAPKPTRQVIKPATKPLVLK